MIVPDFYEGNADPSFIRLRLAGVRCVGLKASEGLTYVDHTLAARARNARLAGLRRIFYHFARPDLHELGPRFEADNLLTAVGSRLRPDDYLALDFESGLGVVPGPRLVAWARLFSRHVHKRCGRWPLFYASRNYIESLPIDTPIGGGLWLADYGPNNGRRHPVAAPHPWRHVKLHQFTSRGRLGGASGAVDLSYAERL